MCGAEYILSARREYEHRKQGTQHVCGPCRCPPKPPDPTMVAAMRGWWLARYSLAELRSWPPI